MGWAVEVDFFLGTDETYGQRRAFRKPDVSPAAVQRVVKLLRPVLEHSPNLPDYSRGSAEVAHLFTYGRHVPRGKRFAVNAPNCIHNLSWLEVRGPRAPQKRYHGAVNLRPRPMGFERLCSLDWMQHEWMNLPSTFITCVWRWGPEQPRKGIRRSELAQTRA